MGNWKQRLMENREQGAALIIAIVLLSAMEVLGFALITMSEIDYSVTGNLVRSEEALRSAEQGVMIAIDNVISREADLQGVANGTEIANPPCSASYRGRVAYTGGCGSDPYPRWSTKVIKVSNVSFPKAQPSGYRNFLYRIESTGESARGLVRTIIVEIGIKGKGSLNIKSGEGAAALGLESKLAATSYSE